MSYDLAVYAPRSVQGAELRALVSGMTGLDVGDHDDKKSWFTVIRGAKGRYCFTIDGPFRVDPEDVPAQVTGVLLAASHVYNITVEGSAAADIPHAVRFARRIAQDLDGAVVDQQTDTVWSKGTSRVAAKPERNERVSVVALDWYSSKAELDPDFGAVWVAQCRHLFPEALPRRFGEFEPLQHKLAEVGDEGFARTWIQAASTLFFAATNPCIGGAMGAGPNEKRPRLLWHMSLNLHRLPVMDPRWREALRRLFVATAQHLHAFYASAQVTREHIWSGRGLWSDGKTEWAVSPARVNGWMGLPPYPVWWAWYGPEYRDLVAGHLVQGEKVDHPEGIFHGLSSEPHDRDGLAEVLNQHSQWVPSELVVTVLRNDGRVLPVPIRVATRIPERLA